MEKKLLTAAVALVSISFLAPVGFGTGVYLGKRIMGDEPSPQITVASQEKQNFYVQPTASKKVSQGVVTGQPSLSDANQLMAKIDELKGETQQRLKSAEDRAAQLRVIADQMLKQRDEAQSNEGAEVVSQPAQIEPAKGQVAQPNTATVKPRLGYDGHGNALNEKGLQLQISLIAKNLSRDLTVNFNAKGEEKGRIFVFTDPTCSFCKKLHGQIDELNNRGYTVSYLLFPRKGVNSSTAVSLERAWCSSDQVASVNSLYSGNFRAGEGDCSLLSPEKQAVGNAVEQATLLANFFEVRGTPTYFADNGGIGSGFSSVDKMLKNLGF